MDFDQLRLAIRIAERGSISAAARDLDVSASLATRSLAKLEKHAGATLFRRTTRKLEPTEAGRIFVAWAKKSMEGLESTLNHVNDLGSKPSGLVRVACPELFATRFLPSVMTDIAERYPDLRFNVVMVDNVRDLPHDEFDAAVHIGKRPGNPFIARKVLDIEPLLCASPSYIARYGDPSQPEDLGKHRVLAHALYHDPVWMFERRGVRTSHRVTAYLSATNSILLHEMAVAGVGIARLTRRIATADLKAGRLIPILPDFRCVGGEGEPSAIWVIRPDRYFAQRTRVFLDMVIAHLRKTT